MVNLQAVIGEYPLKKSIYDFDEPGPSKEDIAGAIQDAEEYMRLWRKRALYATAAFFLSCASVTPFLAGHSLHDHWESFGRYLILLSMALLLPFVICVIAAIDAWFFLHKLKRGKLWP